MGCLNPSVLEIKRLQKFKIQKDVAESGGHSNKRDYGDKSDRSVEDDSNGKSGHSDKKSLLKVSGLGIGYGSVPIAKNLDFEVSKGQLTAIVGVNGIGKSTLLRTLGTLQSKISGSILLDGNPIERYPPQDLASRIALVLTEPMASKNMSVREVIALGRQPYTNWIGRLSQSDKDKIQEALALLELEGIQRKKCFELSDGQLQRTMIARAFAQDTEIILMDEPTTHLDLYHKAQILKLMKSIAHETNRTILFTTHEIEMAIQLCDSLLILDGNKNPFGSSEQLIEQKAFENLFPSDVISFDAMTGSFQIRP